ncbi:MAG: FtsX-like permease family protein [Vicingaceae bacterium]|nr:FtsX-like permease family protein [Vicingaceae bacterium]
MNSFRIILGISKIHLISRIKQTSIAALGVTFGISAFIILMGFMNGLNGLLDGLILNRTPHIHIYNDIKPSENQPVAYFKDFSEAFNVVHSVKPKQTQKKIHNAQPLINYLNQNPKVKGAIPQVTAQGFYISGSQQLNGMITGIDALAEAKLFNFDNYITEGNVLDLKNNVNGILLGIGVAKKMSLKIGDRIQIANVNGEIIPLKIVGLFQSGLAEIDNTQSYVNVKTAQRILSESENYITDINVKLFDIEDAVPMSKFIANEFTLTAIDIKTANAQFETGTSVRNLISYAVSITLLLVAGFGIYNILNMMIYEKMNDIAILKATGFSGNDVKRIFISQAVIIGIVGGILGLILGYLVSRLIDNIPFETEAIPNITTYPVVYNYVHYIIAMLFAMISTFIAGYLPAQKAKNIDPVEIIRGQ